MFPVFVPLRRALAPWGVRHPLDREVRKIAAALPEVVQIGPAALAARLASDKRPAIFDARSEQEFAVSHLPGAVRVPPDIEAEEFTARFSPKAADRDAVFACAVGWRSARLAARVQHALAEQGTACANLAGGVFAWRNEGWLLERKGQRTGDVHPYDARWGRMIDDPKARVYAPPSPAA